MNLFHKNVFSVVSHLKMLIKVWKKPVLMSNFMFTPSTLKMQIKIVQVLKF